MQAQVKVQPTVKTSANAETIRVTIKPVAPMMRETAKPAPQAEQPRYDFVGIAG